VRPQPERRKGYQRKSVSRSGPRDAGGRCFCVSCCGSAQRRFPRLDPLGDQHHRARLVSGL